MKGILMKRIILAVALSAMFAPLASAENAPADDQGKKASAVETIKSKAHKMHLKAADLNGDGVIDLEEFSKRAVDQAEQSFGKLDVDGNGSISKEEYVTFSAETSQKIFAKMDRNGDGVLSADDMQRKHPKKHKDWKKKDRKNAKDAPDNDVKKSADKVIEEALTE